MTWRVNLGHCLAPSAFCRPILALSFVSFCQTTLALFRQSFHRRGLGILLFVLITGGHSRNTVGFIDHATSGLSDNV